MNLGERKIPSRASEPLSDARTKLADLFSGLLAWNCYDAAGSISPRRDDVEYILCVVEDRYIRVILNTLVLETHGEIIRERFFDPRKMDLLRIITPYRS